MSSKRILRMASLGCLFSFVLTCAEAYPLFPRSLNSDSASLKMSNGMTLMLIVSGDLLPELVINGKNVPPIEFSLYEVEVQKLLSVIEEKHQMASHPSRVQQKIFSDLVAKKIVKAVTNILSYRLTDSELTVNGKRQPQEVLAFFRDKYLRSADCVLFYERQPSLSLHSTN